MSTAFTDFDPEAIAATMEVRNEKRTALVQTVKGLQQNLDETIAFGDIPIQSRTEIFAGLAVDQYNNYLLNPERREKLLNDTGIEVPEDAYEIESVLRNFSRFITTYTQENPELSGIEKGERGHATQMMGFWQTYRYEKYRNMILDSKMTKKFKQAYPEHASHGLLEAFGIRPEIQAFVDHVAERVFSDFSMMDIESSKRPLSPNIYWAIRNQLASLRGQHNTGFTQEVRRHIPNYIEIFGEYAATLDTISRLDE